MLSGSGIPKKRSLVGLIPNVNPKVVTRNNVGHTVHSYAPLQERHNCLLTYTLPSERPRV